MEPKPGNTLEITMDYNIQSYCEQAAKRVMEEKEADAVAIILMDPQNGEIYAMANVPEFNLMTRSHCLQRLIQVSLQMKKSKIY